MKLEIRHQLLEPRDVLFANAGVDRSAAGSLDVERRHPVEKILTLGFKLLAFGRPDRRRTEHQRDAAAEDAGGEPERHVAGPAGMVRQPGDGERVEIGRFLTRDEKKRLVTQLRWMVGRFA